MVEQWEWRSPEIAALYANGSKSLLTLRSLMAQQFVKEKMDQLQSFEDLSLDCLRDWRFAFEIVLALNKIVGAAPSPADEHMIALLATSMYQDIHYKDARKKMIIGVSIAGVLALTPWLLHTLGLTRGAKRVA